jgi:tetratricopeptide (TPR) repeat protein
LADAEHSLAGVLSASPSNSNARFLLGVALARSGKIGQAIDAFQQYLGANPHSVDGLNWLSIACRRAGRLDDAERASARALRVDPQNADSLNNLGLVYLGQGKFEAALGPLSKAVAVRSSEPQFRHNLGTALQSLGRETEAAECFRMACNISDRALPSLLALGNLMLKHGSSLAAVECANKALAIDPMSIPGHMLAARALANLEDGSRAETHVRRVLALDPGNSVAHAMLGFRQQTAGDFVAAEASFQRSLDLNPNQGLSHWGLKQGKKATEADRPELERLAELAENPLISPGERSHLFYASAKAYADLKDYSRAMDNYDKANGCVRQVHRSVQAFDPAAYKAGIDRTIELFTRDFIERHSHLGCPSRKPIFIVGMMRSGTTLMEQILSSHPEVTAGGELQFWLERAPKVVDPGTRTVEAGRARRLIDDYLELLSKISPDGYVTDKMPSNIQIVGLIRILFPNAKILNMNRNPVDNALSIYFTPYEFPPDFAHVRENIVFAYRRNEELTEHWRRQLEPQAFLDVQYESLVDHSEAVIRSVLEFCGLDWDDRCLRHGENQRSVNTPSVWQVRQPIYKTSKDRWRNYEHCLGSFSELAPE